MNQPQPVWVSFGKATQTGAVICAQFLPEGGTAVAISCNNPAINARVEQMASRVSLHFRRSEEPSIGAKTQKSEI